jgi:hypothetical protein
MDPPSSIYIHQSVASVWWYPRSVDLHPSHSHYRYDNAKHKTVIPGFSLDDRMTIIDLPRASME